MALREFIPLSIQSTMYLPFNEFGHVFYRPVPCVVVGKYNEVTGTIILETVICEGRHYDMLEISNEDWQKFHEEMRESVLTLEF